MGTMDQHGDHRTARPEPVENAGAVGMSTGTRHMLIADLRAEIQLAAYFRYVDRGMVDGHDVEDWLAAEEGLNGY